MNIYYYLFYKLYKFWDIVSIPKFWSDVKAVLTIVVLEEFISFALLAYYKELLDDKNILLKEKWIYVLITAICVISNYIIFYSKDYWKQIIIEFDKWPKNKNNLGSYLVGSCILIIIIIFILACYLYKI